jgi:glycosyltransferase involved in cell wall biosynthesis
MIEERYLLVSYITIYVDGRGVRYTDVLWEKDLINHLNHIRNLTLASPRCALPDDRTGLLPLDDSEYVGKITYLDLPKYRSVSDALIGVPSAAAILWKAIGHSDIVHICIGGWPIDLAWIVGPMARLRRRFLLIGVAGAGWRMGWRRPIRLRLLGRAVVFEVMGRFCVNISHLAVFTQAGYLRQLLLPWRRGRGHVIPASWIDEEGILSEDQAKVQWEEKLREAGRPLRAGFVGSLMPGKGVLVLLDALDRLDQRGVPVELDIFGKGKLHEACMAAAARARRSITVTMRGTLPYGPAFFEALRGLDVLLVPSISDEQPRIVYDAFSQAIPVVASDTPGLAQCVTDGRDGKIVPSGDPHALVDAIIWAASNRPALRDLGIASLRTAHSLTHAKMRARWAAIILEARGAPAP